MKLNQLTREEARAQWEKHTKELDLKHTFSFDEAWDLCFHSFNTSFEGFCDGEDLFFAFHNNNLYVYNSSR